MIYYIRYNVDHKHGNSEFPWRVFESEDKFYLTKNIMINRPSFTFPTMHPSGDIKYSIYCDGVMTVNTPELIKID